MAKREKKLDLEKLQRYAIGDHRGRKSKAPEELAELRKLQRLGASNAYLRLKILAQSRKLHNLNTALYISLNQWIYEIVHGKPKVAMEGKLDVPIRITYQLVPPKEQIDRAEELLALKVSEVESSSEYTPGDITESVKVN